MIFIYVEHGNTVKDCFVHSVCSVYFIVFYIALFFQKANARQDVREKVKEN